MIRDALALQLHYFEKQAVLLKLALSTVEFRLNALRRLQKGNAVGNSE